MKKILITFKKCYKSTKKNPLIENWIVEFVINIDELFRNNSMQLVFNKIFWHTEIFSSWSKKPSEWENEIIRILLFFRKKFLSIPIVLHFLKLFKHYVIFLFLVPQKVRCFVKKTQTILKIFQSTKRRIEENIFLIEKALSRKYWNAWKSKISDK